MISSLMSCFDPSCNFPFFVSPLKWLVLILVMMFPLNKTIWLSPSGVGLPFLKLKQLVLTMLTGLFPEYKVSLILGMSLVTFLSVTNLVGLLPWSFPPSSHLVFSLSLSLPLWGASVIFFLKKNVSEFLAHMCPNGAESILGLTLVWVELISLLIRPISLAVRLMANITAGHVLMTLLESSISLLPLTFPSIVKLIVLTFLLTCELGVALIQAYVFTNLVMLYLAEAH